MNTTKINSNVCQKTELMNRMVGNCNRLTQELNRRMKLGLGLSLAKFDVLLVIKDAEGSEITMSNLSRELLVSNANMTGMTTRLQADGLVEKKPLQSDRRIYSVTLTDEGRAKLEKAIERHQVWVDELMACVDADDVKSLNRVFDKMAFQEDAF